MDFKALETVLLLYALGFFLAGATFASVIITWWFT